MRRGVRILALGCWLAAPHSAVSAEGAQDEIRKVIEHQIEAFRRDDGSAAYEDAAPGIRRLFPTDRDFMDLVQRSYKPVYRPRRYVFGETRRTEAGLDQGVDIQDESGVDWVAVYSLEQQPDGSWKISGCTLVRAPGQAV